MSIKLMSSIFDLHFEKPLVKFVFIALADCANNEGECYPSIPTIAKKCSLNERQVYRSINELQKMGLISKENRCHKDGRNRSNIYMITLTDSHPHPDPQSPSPLTDSHPSKENHKKEPSKESILSDSKKSDDLDDFEILWKEYPNKSSGKQSAIKAYSSAKKRKVSIDQILSGIERYKKYVEQRRSDGFPGLQYKLFATWLRGEEWKSQYVIEASQKQTEDFFV
jgi:hypothetical protein